MRNQYAWWREALKDGRGVETGDRNDGSYIRSGFYRSKNDAISFWRATDADSKVLCWRSGGFPAPTERDAMEDLFSFCSKRPISYEAYQAFRETGRWADEPAPVVVDKTLPPFQAAEQEAQELKKQAQLWIEQIKEIKTQEQADLAGRYAEKFAAIESKAQETRKAEKRPHWDAGLAIDASWNPVIEFAASNKVWAKKLVEPYLIARKRSIEADQKRRDEERIKADLAAATARANAHAAGLAAPVENREMFPPAPEKAKAGKVALRKVEVCVIADYRAFLIHLSTQNAHPADLCEALLKVARDMLKGGIKPPGVEIKEEERAA